MAIGCGKEPYTISTCFTLNIQITINVFASVIAALDYQSLDSKQTWVYLYMNQKTGPKNAKNLWSPLGLDFWPSVQQFPHFGGKSFINHLRSLRGGYQYQF